MSILDCEFHLPITDDLMSHQGFEKCWGWLDPKLYYCKTIIVSKSGFRETIHCRVECNHDHFKMTWTASIRIPNRFYKRVSNLEEVMDNLDGFNRWCNSHQYYKIK